jgi:hypothetical protein
MQALLCTSTYENTMIICCEILIDVRVGCETSSYAMIGLAFINRYIERCVSGHGSVLCECLIDSGFPAVTPMK